MRDDELISREVSLHLDAAETVALWCLQEKIMREVSKNQIVLNRQVTESVNIKNLGKEAVECLNIK